MRIQSTLITLLCLTSACGAEDPASDRSQTKDISEGRVEGLASYWINVSKTLVYSQANSWAFPSGKTYFPQAEWKIDEDILWSHDARMTTIESEGLKSTELTSTDQGQPSHIFDWFRYFDTEHKLVDSPLWRGQELDVKGEFSLSNIQTIAGDLNLVKEIRYHTFFRAKGVGQATLKTRIHFWCIDTGLKSSAGIEVPGDTYTLPSLTFEKDVSGTTDIRNVSEGAWEYLRSDVVLKEEQAKSLKKDCPGSLMAKLQISLTSLSGQAVSAQFISTEYVRINNEN